MSEPTATLTLNADEIAVIYCAVSDFAAVNADLISKASIEYLSQIPDEAARMMRASGRILDMIDNMRRSDLTD